MSSKIRTMERHQQKEMQNQKTGDRVVANAIHREVQAYQGPLPPADEFAKYENACAGAADRIISMAERQASHRQEIEKKLLEASSRNSLLGLLFALVIALMVLTAGTYCILEGHDTAGSVIVGIDLVGLCTVFIYGTNANKKQ